MSEITRFYSKTEIAVLPGDYIVYKGFWGGDLKGRVAYVPFKSLLNNEFHDGLIIEWMIELENGYRRMIFNKKGRFVSGRVFFIKRSDDNYYK